MAKYKLTRPGSVLDRDAEWRKLVELWSSDRPELVFVLGRRRVGKSFTLVPFARAVGGIYYQATRQTEAEQLRVSSRIVGGHFDDAALLAGAGFPDWTSLFRYILERVGQTPFLVAIGTVWQRHIEPGLDDYMGPVFEEICRAAMHARPEILPFEPFRTGRWWRADSHDQVDVVVLSGQGELLAGECKWGAVGARDLDALRRHAGLVAAELDGVSRVHYAPFSGRGVFDESVGNAAEAGEVRLFGPDNLFRTGA